MRDPPSCSCWKGWTSVNSRLTRWLGRQQLLANDIPTLWSCYPDGVQFEFFLPSRDEGILAYRDIGSCPSGATTRPVAAQSAICEGGCACYANAMQYCATAFGHSFFFILETLFYYTKFRYKWTAWGMLQISSNGNKSGCWRAGGGSCFWEFACTNIIDECQYCLLACI